MVEGVKAGVRVWSKRCLKTDFSVRREGSWFGNSVFGDLETG